MNLFKQTLLYKTYKFISSYIQYKEDLDYISDILYSDEFRFVLKQYLKVNIKKDWLGRLYGVINPLIDIDGNLDINNVVIELDDNNSNDNEYVKTWLHRQLKLVADLFKINNLYNYITLSVEKVGPIRLDNYLITFDIVSRKEMAKWFKKFMKHTILYIIIAVIAFISFKYIYIL